MKHFSHLTRFAAAKYEVRRFEAVACQAGPVACRSQDVNPLTSSSMRLLQCVFFVLRAILVHSIENTLSNLCPSGVRWSSL